MDQFVPEKKEEVIIVKITRREAILIQKIRKHAFGLVTVHKKNAQIYRIESNVSEMIDPEQEITLE